MTIHGVHVTWWECGPLALTMVAAYFVPLFAGVGVVRSIMLGLGWQLFLLTLVQILTAGGER